MAYVVVDGTGQPLGAFRTKAEAQRHKASWNQELRSSGRRSVYDRLKIVKKNAARSNPTKKQKREKAAKTAAKRRVAVALAKFLKQANPAMKTAGARVTRLKGGGFTIRPIKAVKRR
jgi:hypothetical protein